MDQSKGLTMRVYGAWIGSVCGLLLLTVMGCDSETSSKASPANNGTGSTRPKIALVMKSLANEFFSTMAVGAEKHQAAHSDQYDLIVNGIKDERDLSRQVALVDEMIAAGVQAIVIAPADSKALVPALRRAKEAGVVVVNIDNRLDVSVLTEEKLSIPFVGPDNRLGSKKVAEYLAARLKSGDQVAILEGIRTSFNGQQRKLGFEDAATAAGLKVVSSQSADWETGLANTITASILQENPDVKGVLACNDSMALGALAAVRSAGLTDKVMIVGFDNIGAVQQAVKEGTILATADQHGDQLAVYGIEYALQLLSDPNAKVEDRETPVDLITADSLK
jgi:ribose transport system substrate-binding protein